MCWCQDLFIRYSQKFHSGLYPTISLGQVLVGTSGLVDVIFALLTLLVPLTTPSLTSAAALPMSMPRQACADGEPRLLPYHAHKQLDHPAVVYCQVSC